MVTDNHRVAPPSLHSSTTNTPSNNSLAQNDPLQVPTTTLRPSPKNRSGRRIGSLWKWLVVITVLGVVIPLVAPSIWSLSSFPSSSSLLLFQTSTIDFASATNPLDWMVESLMKNQKDGATFHPQLWSIPNLTQVLVALTRTSNSPISTSSTWNHFTTTNHSSTKEEGEDSASSHSNNNMNDTPRSDDLPRITVIPKPKHWHQSPGTPLAISATTNIYISHDSLEPEATLLAQTMRASTGFDLPIHVISSADPQGCPQGGNICLLLVPSPGRTFLSALTPNTQEAHVVHVGRHGVIVASFTRKGLFYGTQTVLQLLPPAIFQSSSSTTSTTNWTLPLVQIHDAPRFGWRGLHLDVSRHFMPKLFVLKLLRVMGLHKLNSLHLHLTDDQGWRLEIAALPLLTNISAWRAQTIIGKDKPRRYDGKRYGGFYTKDDIREMVRVASQYHITIVPEIEMPGHTQAVVAAYPHVGCRPDKTCKVKEEWGVSKHIYCAGSDKTFDFLETILTEVMELFPSEYIHVGGDEVDKIHWETCELCQARMKEEKLNSVEQLQTYFIRRIETFLNKHGRKMIGWDEILTAGLSQQATIMSWRGVGPGMRAARRGNQAILAPVENTYFDWYQSKNTSAEPLAWGGFTPLDKVYDFDPLVAPLPADKTHFVLGGQAQLWTEYMPNPQQVEYMAFPRAAALAEAVWKPKTPSLHRRQEKQQRQRQRRNDERPSRENEEYEDFYHRLMDGHLPRLDALKVNYRRPTHMYEPDTDFEN